MVRRLGQRHGIDLISAASEAFFFSEVSEHTAVGEKSVRFHFNLVAYVNMTSMTLQRLECAGCMCFYKDKVQLKTRIKMGVGRQVETERLGGSIRRRG